MDRIEIPGRATYSPVALTDLLFGAPLVSRLLLGAVLPGQLVAAGAFGYYAGSAARDWVARSGVRYVDFQREYGADVRTLTAMSPAARRGEVAGLAATMNAGWTGARVPRQELAALVGARLTAYLAEITGQEVVISSEVREFTIQRLLIPFALGACDPISGDIAIFRDTGVFEPHVLAHEFCHRIGYLKELHAQVLAYLALRTSGNPVLVQAARAERLHRHLAVLSGGKGEAFRALVDEAGLRPELHAVFRSMTPAADVESPPMKLMRAAYDRRMRLFGQNGLSDYDEGFTNLLWTFGHSETARQPREQTAL